jgi:hypothetical protein
VRCGVYCNKGREWDAPLLRTSDGIEEINTSEVEDEVKGKVEDLILNSQP